LPELTSDDFDGPRLGLQWQWHGNPSPGWASLSARPGFLRLAAVPHQGTLWSATHLLLQKLPAPAFSATARLDPGGLRVGERAGLVVMGTDYALLAVERTAGGFRLLRVTARGADQGGAEGEDESVAIGGTPLHLRVSIEPEAVAGFASSADGRTYVPRGPAFTAQPGRWIGAKVGLSRARRRERRRSATRNSTCSRSPALIPLPPRRGQRLGQRLPDATGLSRESSFFTRVRAVPRPRPG
jgi:hypothetical protein